MITNHNSKMVNQTEQIHNTINNTASKQNKYVPPKLHSNNNIKNIHNTLNSDSN
jgi:hypothetical protein